MVDLVPASFSRLVSRAFGELAQRGSIYDLPAAKFFLGSARHDFGVEFHGRRASSPLGPAAGPHSQMAQNIVLAWLGGSRIIELKTVQILDQLQIPRPCIDMRNVGYNVEWSQELRLQQSLEEYVKASMLITMLASELDLAPGFGEVIFDMSVGYDLAGIRSAPVQAFLTGMQDAAPLVERFREQIPRAHAHLRDLPFVTRLADTLTLSTFHGCPPDEIEKIIDYLLHHNRLHCVIKLNPTLLGADEVDRLLRQVMGYQHIRVPGEAFDKDTSWQQAEAFVDRLRQTASGLGLGLGVKFSNTLIVEHNDEFLPESESVKYLSGPPLHVLAANLVRRFRRRFANEVPISFSAGIDKTNFADAVALGLTPITVCTDLLKPGGYARQLDYAKALIAAMDGVGATNIDGLIRGVSGLAGASLDQAVLHNTETYVEGLERNPHFSLIGNTKTPKKVGTDLALFDCLTCDKCVPVCPNDANFTLTIAAQEIPVQTLYREDVGWRLEVGDPLVLRKKHQIANFADFCNECGNCDIFCPENGGPYLEKPRLFGSEAEWSKYPDRDGFYLHHDAQRIRCRARFAGVEYAAAFADEQCSYAGPGFQIQFRRGDLPASVSGQASAAVDMRWFHIIDVLRRAIYESGDVHWLSIAD